MSLKVSIMTWIREFAIDHDNFMESRTVLLLNSFLKKGTKQYKAEVKLAERIIEKYQED